MPLNLAFSLVSRPFYSMVESTARLFVDLVSFIGSIGYKGSQKCNFWDRGPKKMPFLAQQPGQATTLQSPTTI